MKQYIFNDTTSKILSDRPLDFIQDYVLTKVKDTPESQRPHEKMEKQGVEACLLYTSPSPRDA